MAALKTPKTELIAIYRLEFYKKKKNWKLSDARNEKEAQKCVTNNNLLNKTYSIEANLDDDLHALNDAFLVDEPETEVPTSTITLCKQILEPISACQQCQQPKKPQKPWADYVDGILQLEEDDGGDRGNVHKCNGDEFEEFDGDCIGGMVWTNSGYPQNWTGGTTAQVDMVQETVCPEPLEWVVDNTDQLTPWPDDQIWLPDIWSEDKLLMQSLEDIDEFLIGAHNAPHSSEIELCVPEEAEMRSNVSMWSASHMSSAQLAATLQQHVRSLSALLKEGRRRRFRSTLSLDMCAANHFELTPRDVFSTDFSYEAFPTRDTGFHPLQTPDGASNTPLYQGLDPLLHTGSNHLSSRLLGAVGPTVSRRGSDRAGGAPLQYGDGFVGGSFRNTLQVGLGGRGRGRLPDEGAGNM